MTVRSGMPMPYRDVRPVAESLFSRFVGELSEKLDDPSLHRAETCRDAIASLYGVTLLEDALLDESVPLSTGRSGPRSTPATSRSSRSNYADVDAERYAAIKPMIWLWIMFDRSPLGQNAWLGHRLRRALAERIFRRCGRNAKFWQYVEFTYGYNISLGDDVVVHRYAFLDDRGGLDIGNRVSISDYVSVYSHTHDVNDIRQVSLVKTVIEDHARLTYHSTVLAGSHVGKDGMVGAMALATKPAPGMHVSVGIPARPVRPKARPCPYCEEEAQDRGRSTPSRT